MNEGRSRTVVDCVAGRCWWQFAPTIGRTLRADARCHAGEHRQRDLLGLPGRWRARGAESTRLGGLDALGWELIEVTLEELRLRFQDLWDCGWTESRISERVVVRDRIHEVSTELFLWIQGLSAAEAADIASLEPCLLIKIRELAARHFRRERFARDKSKKYSRDESELEKALGHVPSALQELEAEEIIDAAEKELAKLSPQRFTVFALRKYEQMSIAEIAKKLGLSESTVSNTLTAAMRQFLAAMEKIRRSPPDSSKEAPDEKP
jgi:RNA polymerase sigma factor (sigma-70 family)